MKYQLLMLLLLSGIITVQAQTKGTIRIQNDTIFQKNNPAFVFREETKGNQSIYFVAGLNKKPQAAIFLLQQDSSTTCSARFPSLSVRYDVKYQKVDFITLMESYFKNKIFLNGAVDSANLAKYCRERDITLTVINTKKPTRALVNDSAMAVKAKEVIESQISFIIDNHSPKQLNAKIGTSAANRITLINSGTTADEHALPGESVCFFDNDNKDKGCITVKKGLKKITVDEAGKVREEY